MELRCGACKRSAVLSLILNLNWRCLEIEILSITGKWKVSQNQPEINKQGVVAGLSNEGTSDSLKIANLVQTHITESNR